MSAAHTPGPWHSYVQSFPHEVLICTLGPCANYDSPVKDQIAWTPKNPFVVGSDRHAEWKAQSRSNARLISAAPDMLAMIKALRRAIASMGGDLEVTAPESINANTYGDELRRIDTLIAKAEGQS